MLSQSAQTNPQSLKLTRPLPLTNHPAVVYLNGLSHGSRPTMTGSLYAIAQILTNGECDLYTLEWSKLRYQHTAAIQSVLLEKYEATTAKKMMTALRRVLATAYKLEEMDATSYRKATDLPSIKATSRVAGRALTTVEITSLVEVCQSDAFLLSKLNGRKAHSSPHLTPATFPRASASFAIAVFREYEMLL